MQVDHIHVTTEVETDHSECYHMYKAYFIS